MNKPLHPKGVRKLTAAIILLAVRDYRTALADDDSRVISECERFFRSEWFESLTRLDGDYLIREIRREHKEGKLMSYRALRYYNGTMIRNPKQGGKNNEGNSNSSNTKPY